MKKSILRFTGAALAAVLAWGMTGCANDTDSHEHTFATEWNSDATYHWHAATCEHSSEVKDKAEHNFSEYSSNGDASEESDGTKTRWCYDCFYEDTVRDVGSKITVVSTPVFSVASSEVEFESTVAITCASKNATIYYTTDGTIPTSSSTTYTEEIILRGAVTIKAIAAKSGMDDSSVASASYTIKPNTMIKVAGCETGVFYISNTELTYAKWYEVYQWAIENGYKFQNLGREGSKGVDGVAPTANSNHPVTYVSWRDAIVWCNAASEKEHLTPCYYLADTTDFTDTTKIVRFAENYRNWGSNKGNETDVNPGDGLTDNAVWNKNADGYRLPTSDEWKYAAMGGQNYVYSGSDDIEEVGWYYGNSPSGTQAVGLKKANGFFLSDMSGNVEEWCWNMFSETETASRVIVGGSYYTAKDNCRVEYKPTYMICNRNAHNGFRVVRNAN